MALYPHDLKYIAMTWEEFEAAMIAEGWILKLKISDPERPGVDYAEWESQTSDQEPIRITRGRGRLTAFKEYLQKVSDRLIVSEKEDCYKVFRAAFRFAKMD